MSCCCTNTYLGLCSVGTCATDVISLGIPATFGGIHKLTFTFLGVDYSLEKNFELGDDLNFPTSSFNENAEVIAQIKDPNGDTLQFFYNDIQFDCFQISTKINYSIPIPNSQDPAEG